MKYQVSLCGTATVEDLAPGLDVADVLEAHLVDVMDHLVELEDGDAALSDADMSAGLAVGRVEISIVVDADSIEGAAAAGMVAIRCAVHAAGGYTPGWETAQPATWALELEGSTQRPLELIP